jgi:hypothetical protein
MTDEEFCEASLDIARLMNEAIPNGTLNIVVTSAVGIFVAMVLKQYPYETAKELAKDMIELINTTIKEMEN